MKPANSKNGFTLMELLVYMAILGVIVIIAGEAFSSSTKFRVRTQNMLKATQEAENAAMLMKGDVTQMGAKSARNDENATDASDKYKSEFPLVMISQDVGMAHEDDSSSYLIRKDNGFDRLEFFRLRYKDDGSYGAVEFINWYVSEDSVLKRSCKTFSGEETEECPKSGNSIVDIASGVSIFKVIPGIPGVGEDTSVVIPGPGVKQFKFVPRFGSGYFSYVSADPAQGGESVTLSGFVANYDFENEQPYSAESSENKRANQVFVGEKDNTLGDWRSSCKKVNLEADVEYEISFRMGFSEDASRMFCPGRDHMSVGFRKVSDGERIDYLDDFMFYPPVSSGSATKRSMRFSVPKKVEDVCMAFTFASYSPVAASGRVNFSEVRLKKVEAANYLFDESKTDAMDYKDKKNVKAFQLQLQISRGASGGGRGETGNVTLVIPTPSNGPRD